MKLSGLCADYASSYPIITGGYITVAGHCVYNLPSKNIHVYVVS